MAIYAIGDIQGCYDALNRLLEKLQFDTATDTLWLVGDLVNRGPKSLQVLRFVKSLGENAVCVLGNHDLNLLAVSHGIRKSRRGDTLNDILHAPDSQELLDWLRYRPLIHFDPTWNTAMVHAGLPLKWNIDDALQYAEEVHQVLRSPTYPDFLQNMYGNKPRRWRKKLDGWKRLRFITNAFTRMRYCDLKGRLDLDEKHSPGSQPRDLQPWFDLPGRRSRDTRIVFGHWSTLGLHTSDNVIALDTGCVWGGALTAVRIDTRKSPKPIAISCDAEQQPGQI